MDDAKLLFECSEYFKNNKGFNRVFKELRKKYRAFGDIRGRVNIKKLNSDEKTALSLFFGINYAKFSKNSDINFSVSDFITQLDCTKFSGVDYKSLIDYYFNENIQKSSIEKSNFEDMRDYFFDEIIDSVISKSPELNDFLISIIKKQEFGSVIYSEYRRDKDNIKIVILNICEALKYLRELKLQDSNRVKLAMLANKISSNPHYFDKNTLAGKLLIYSLAYFSKNDGNISKYQFNAQEILEIYYNSWILPDDISSFTTLYGISLYRDEKDEIIKHGAYEEFIRNNEFYLVSLSNLSNIVKIECESDSVFVIENQMVFSYICEILAQENDKKFALMCSSGQMKIATLIVIELLCKSGKTIYYSGDMDVDGIMIADRLISKHKNIKPWRMSASDYLISMSEEEIAQNSLSRLDKLCNSELKELAKVVVANCKKSFQESLIEQMINDIKNGVIKI